MPGDRPRRSRPRRVHVACEARGGSDAVRGDDIRRNVPRQREPRPRDRGHAEHRCDKTRRPRPPEAGRKRRGSDVMRRFQSPFEKKRRERDGHARSRAENQVMRRTRHRRRGRGESEHRRQRPVGLAPLLPVRCIHVRPSAGAHAPCVAAQHRRCDGRRRQSRRAAWPACRDVERDQHDGCGQYHGGVAEDGIDARQRDPAHVRSCFGGVAASRFPVDRRMHQPPPWRGFRRMSPTTRRMTTGRGEEKRRPEGPPSNRDAWHVPLQQRDEQQRHDVDDLDRRLRRLPHPIPLPQAGEGDQVPCGIARSITAAGRAAAPRC